MLFLFCVNLDEGVVAEYIVIRGTGCDFKHEGNEIAEYVGDSGPIREGEQP